MHPISRRYLIDSLFVGLLILYALAGVLIAPVHGDEATTMYVARDWYTIFVNHDLSNILYRTDLTNQTLIDAQEYRLRMGASARYAIGFLTNMTGMSASDLTDPWFWGADYNDNVAHGHIAKPPVLFVARLASAFLLVIGIAGVFQIGLRLGGQRYGRILGAIAAFIYTMTPTVLLNGRRAMYEGSTTLFIVLMILAGLEIVRHARLNDPRGQLKRWLLFGLIAGVAVAGKTSMLLVAAPIGAFAAAIDWWQNRKFLVHMILYNAAGAVVALVAFLALNPAWWSQPLKMPAIVARLNLDTTGAQVGYYGGWAGLADRVLALATEPFQNAQYFEASAEWQQWIGAQIRLYQRSGLYGIAWGGFGIILYPLMLLGMAALAIYAVVRRDGQKLFILASLFGVMAAVFVATPLPWQRYYLPLVALWTLTIAFGLVYTVQFVWQQINSRRKDLPRSA
jgi:4-amino-4-deoxy-L-arabinose transferase-like glycosyltransferase